ncbi:MAG: prepilin-type N-terminal cleavage/methylation domain-containing protein, partial [Actinobacteria bacterium]|nr:prepilin-type N-terminal cleavage/methylation domain-containing protein [Actinomycetota bacterium]
MKRRGGFTILEMVLVLAVIVMLSAMAYPTMAGWFKSEKLKTATDTMREAIAMARHLAIEE